MKRKFKRILSLLMSVVILTGTFVFTGQAEEVTESVTDNSAITETKTVTKTSVSTESKLDILHMDRTVTKNEDGGFDVELSSYLDGVIKSETADAEKKQALDVVFVLDGSGSVYNATGDRSQVYQIVDSILNTLQILKDDGGNHRVGFVTFATAIKQSGTTKSLISINEALLPETNKDAQYKPPLIGDSRYVGNKYLKYYCESTNALGGATYTHLATEKAKTLLEESKSSDHTQICIIITDGIPSRTVEFNESFADQAIEDASAMKANGVDIYAIKAFIRVSDDYVSRMNRFFRRLSSCYDSTAINMDNKCEQKHEDEIYISETNNFETLFAAFKKILKTTSQERITKWLYPLVLNEGSITQDVISPYFTLSGTPTYEIQYAQFNEDGSHNNENWTTRSTGNASVDGQRVYVDSFDYIDHCVAYLNKESSARLVIKYHIDPIENFFGGNCVSTNTPCSASDGTEDVDYLTNGSGIYCDGDFFMDFEDIGVNIPLSPGTIKFNSIDNAPFLSTQVPDKQVEITKFDETYIDGINNAYVDISITGDTENADLNRTENDTLEQKARTTFGKSYSEDESSLYDNFNDEYMAGTYSNKSFFTPSGYQVKKNETFEVKMSVTPSVIAADVKVYETVGAPVEALKIEETGYINTEAKYVAVFDFEYGEYSTGLVPDSLTYEDGTQVEVPDSVTSTSLDVIENYIRNDIVPTYGTRAVYKADSTTYNYISEDWLLTDEKDDVDTSTVYLYYTCKWKYTDSVVDAVPFAVELYYMDTNGVYKTTPDKTYNFMAESNTAVKVCTQNTIDTSYLDRTPVWINNGYVDKSEIENNYDRYSAGGKNLFYGYRIKFNAPDGIEQTNADSGYTDSEDPETYPDVSKVMAYTLDFLVCSSCKNLITDEAENESGQCYCSYCSSYQNAFKYSDFILNDNLSISEIVVDENASENKIKLYFERQKHSITVNVINEEISEDPQTYTLSGYAGASMSDTFVNDEEYRSVLYATDNFTPVEQSKYFTIEMTSLIYCTDGYAWYSEDFSYNSGTAVRDVFENYALYNNLIPYHDAEMTITLSPIYQDITISKTWDQTAKNNNLQQNCIFTLYELENDGNVKRITQLTINNGRKKVSGLRMGKTYVVVEGQWSYKTAPSENIITRTVLSAGSATFNFVNNATETIAGATCDKGLSNVYSTGGVITQTAITK